MSRQPNRVAGSVDPGLSSRHVERVASDPGGAAHREHLYPGGELRTATPGRRLAAYALDTAISLLTLSVGWLIWLAIVAPRGQTPGKALLRLYTLRGDGRIASAGYVWIRELFIKGLILNFVFFATLGVGWLIAALWIFRDRDRQTLWDKLANSHVAQAPPDPLAASLAPKPRELTFPPGDQAGDRWPGDGLRPGGPGAGDARPDVLPRTWRARDMLLGVFGVVLAFVVLLFVVAIASSGDETSPRAAAVATLVFEFSLGGIVLALAAWRRLSLADLGFVRPVVWGPLATAWLGAYMILLAYGAALIVLDALGLPTDFFQGDNTPFGDEVDFDRLSLVILGAAVMVGAPFGEELLFRALLFRGMRGYWRLVPAMALSGFLFAAFHVNPAVIVPFSFVGALFAWSYEESRSLWTAISAHAGFNSVSFIATLIFLE